jgi:hypothetical protein
MLCTLNSYAYRKDSKEWEDRNKRLRDEKERLNNYYLTLKRGLDKTQKMEHAKLKVRNLKFVP